MNVEFHAVYNDYADKCCLTEVETVKLILENIVRNYTITVLSGNEIGTRIRNQFLGKKGRNL